MSAKPPPMEHLRAIDDAGLGVYEFRVYVHIWRVGVSWESQRTIAKKCGISLGSVSSALKGLLDKGMIAYEEKNGRLGLAPAMCSSREQMQQIPVQDVNTVHVVNSDVHVVNADVHHMNGDVHHVNAILSMPIEDMPIEGGPLEGARVRLHPATAAVMAAPLPPPAVRYEPRDRTPDGFKAHSGYSPPPEPEPVKREPSPEALIIGGIANAITEVTGVSAKLVRDDVYTLAADLHGAGYTAAQVRTAYNRQATAGAWHWYAAHWKGKKGDPPTLKDIRETIAGATARATATKKPGPIERALAMLGNQPPDPATA